MEAILFEKWYQLIGKGLTLLVPMYLIFWVWKPSFLQKFRIAQIKDWPVRSKQDALLSILGLSVYIIPTLLALLAKQFFSYSRMYVQIEDYGWPYFFLSFLIFAFGIDTWFYWAHRWMHHHPWLKKKHSVHHRSINITPASAYSFSLTEALINMAPFMILILTVPWHPVMILIFSLYGIFNEGYIHLGYDFGFKWRSKHPLLKWIYSSTHHSLHHQKFNCNYAVYFSFWDKLMGTEDLIIK